ncbi:SOS response-associated peptidase family protein [Sphingomonas hengshuiensis]|uniref:Abasic site processing protein n=1 Tax=Sphingomonas hengshuiensis TaxID=1609977 RepID=A0A7U5CV50_9SPHN|nr:SOS response-associated peptidase [Sphingomonas hengshuiensis]AJP74564.1 hypothetical protein TS85_15625 [Sphingomonas hengshuiensis]
MCNEHRSLISIDEIDNVFREVRIPLRFPEGRPNLPARESIKITDRHAIVRAAAGGDPAAELVVRRWSWPGPTGKPVYNFRSEGRALDSGRCLIIADGFYEFTDPPPVEGAPKRRPKSKWLFTMRAEPWFAIAGIWRAHPEVGEAYTMLTMAPGPDVAPYHSRQIVVLGRADWGRWLDPATPSTDVLQPAPAGTLDVVQIR